MPPRSNCISMLVGVLCIGVDALGTLSVELEVPKQTLLVGEPLAVRVVVRNTGLEDASIPQSLSPIFDVLYEIAKDGVYEEIMGYPKEDANSPGMTLGAGQS